MWMKTVFFRGVFRHSSPNTSPLDSRPADSSEFGLLPLGTWSHARCVALMWAANPSRGTEIMYYCPVYRENISKWFHQSSFYVFDWISLVSPILTLLSLFLGGLYCVWVPKSMWVCACVRMFLFVKSVRWCTLKKKKKTGVQRWLTTLQTCWGADVQRHRKSR